ncbi:hypothetical protein Glove_303g155 [Diversispora epigaea]|uniref:Ribosome biogenesis protein NSA1 n=1 Tax=Diversispora epigaea TaxID=1348612 RepID=A0A397I0Q4_9GLOM|nr:hypothetical protein Glove_303g155 [Diversispora epigaea]
MKFFTGDEAGLIKEISITPSTSQKQEISSQLSHTIKTWDKIDRNKGIQLMYQADILGEKNQIIVARKNGIIQILDPNKDGKVYKEFIEEQINVNNDGKRDARFVGLFANKNTLVTCTDKGIVRYQPILEDNSSSMNKTITLTSDLSRLRVHPKENHIFSCGGKERELSVWDANVWQENNNKDKKKAKIGLLWSAKNENDFLDLRVPVWITDLQFLNDVDTTKLVIGSKYHQIRIYDTKAKRRPVQDFNIGANPVVSLIVGRNSNEIIFSDTIGSVSSVDIRTGKILGRYKGFTGAVTDIAIDKKSTSLVTVGLDRFLRVHEMNATRKLTHKIYLKQRQTCVLVDSSEDEINHSNENNDSEEDEEELWGNMEEIKPKKKIKNS